MHHHVLIHAPTPDALRRARNNALNLLKDLPEAQVRIVANAQAVALAVQGEAHACDAYTYLCPNSLESLGIQSPGRYPVLPHGAVTALVLLQQEGWLYLRA